jgi:thioredoxin 1
MATVQATQTDFAEKVTNHQGMVLVDFHAEWCGPCKATEPIIEELSNEMKDIKFVKVDVDANQDLASEYSIFSIPSFLIFNNGQVIGQFVGAQSKEGFKSEIAKAQGR